MDLHKRGNGPLCRGKRADHRGKKKTCPAMWGKSKHPKKGQEGTYLEKKKKGRRRKEIYMNRSAKKGEGR